MNKYYESRAKVAAVYCSVVKICIHHHNYLCIILGQHQNFITKNFLLYCA